MSQSSHVVFMSPLAVYEDDIPLQASFAALKCSVNWRIRIPFDWLLA